MPNKFAYRVMGFGFSEMRKYTEKIAAKKLSTGSQRLSGLAGSQHISQSQNTLNQQHIKRMKPQKAKALARVKIFSEFGGLSKKAKSRKWCESKEAMRILKSQSDKPNSEGRKEKQRTKKTLKRKPEKITGQNGLRIWRVFRDVQFQKTCRIE